MLMGPTTMSLAASDDVRAAASAVRSLLAQPRAWTQGARARDPQGLATSVNSANAVCWSLDGAIARLGSHGSAYADLTEWLRERLGEPLVRWNDAAERRHGHILTLLDNIIGGDEPRRA